MIDDHTLWIQQLTVLADRLARGDLAALGKLFDLTAARLLRYTQSLTHSREDAEDAVQAAMVRIAQHPGKLAVARLPWAYFLRIARNESLQILQRRKPMQSLSATFEAWSDGDPEACEREEHAHRVREAVRKLPAEQAEVVLLKQWEGMTFAEVAEVVGESPNTVASRYRYALEKLQRSLEPLIQEVNHGW